MTGEQPWLRNNPLAAGLAVKVPMGWLRQPKASQAILQVDFWHLAGDIPAGFFVRRGWLNPSSAHWTLLCVVGNA